MIIDFLPFVYFYALNRISVVKSQITILLNTRPVTINHLHISNSKNLLLCTVQTRLMCTLTTEIIKVNLL